VCLADALSRLAFRWGMPDSFPIAATPSMSPGHIGDGPSQC
jgi:hypothetical protein